ncbi:Ubiquitin ligase complex F-box protein UFO1 [Candida viswanathii]|uniref:Ubiquitin ligase complex F-box protein UFO1 n=1 Tax=Candida viswanathii TaxID=5486 RepID=A0A367Y560_9ASCO|nr:Ubiquitin ligase complex F-box protein UFO1 [Candida viswanathii]
MSQPKMRLGEGEQDHGMPHEQDSLGNTIVKHPLLAAVLSHPKLTIQDLPPELLIQVFTYLDPTRLNTLRLVCKRWNHAINDREVWMKSFQMRFNIPVSSLSFPTISLSLNWMREYSTRLQVIKNWKRGNSVHKIYQILNNEQRFNDVTMIDFNMNKILIYDKKFNNISMGNLSDGKNQSFIPGFNNGFQTNILCCDVNWKYLATGFKNGEINLKNLNTSTSVSQRSSNLKFEMINDKTPIMCLLMSNDAVISGSYSGFLRIWNLQGKVLKEFELGDVVYNVSSDFRKFIVANTKTHVFVIDYQTHEILSKIEIGFAVNDELTETLQYDVLIKLKNTLDVDYGSQRIIICYKSCIRVFNFFDNLNHRELNLEKDVQIVESRFQIASNHKFLNRNPNLVGQDGLLYGNLLSDGSLIVWNARDDARTITPNVRIYPELNHKKYSHGIHNAIVRNDLLEVTSFSLNGSVIAIGGFNGLTNVYDVFTGKFLREISIKFPKRFPYMQNSLVPITSIEMNPNQVDNNGIIVCGDTVQYFEFGEIKDIRQKSNGQQLQKQVNNGSQNKNEYKKKIRDEMEDYNHQIYQRNKSHDLLDKYNGTAYEDEEEEYMMALAISESYHSSRGTSITGSSSLSDSPPLDSSESGAFDEEEMDEELRRVLELSLVEH